MNDTMHEHLNKLRIISKIRSGQRLDTTNGLTVYEESFYNWFIRKYYHDGKDGSVRYLQDLFRGINQFVDQLVSSIDNARDSKRKARKMQVAINMAVLIKSSISGIENLSKTYVTYPKTTAMLEGIVQDFAVVSYVCLLIAIPVNMYVRPLRESISYHGVILHQGLDGHPDPDIDIVESD